MSHHWEGPSEQCPRCGTWTRDLDVHRAEYCIGRIPSPDVTIHELVSTHGYQTVLKWVEDAKKKNDEEFRLREEQVYLKKKGELMDRIRDGNVASSELADLDREWNNRLR